MTNYVALLRGINVGGNSLVKMVDLKAIFEKLGFTTVSTYINSGNVLFSSNETNKTKLTTTIEKALVKELHMELRVVVHSQSELKNVVDDIPKDWTTKDFRCYIAFLKEPTTPSDVLKELQLKEDIDFAKAGKYAVIMGTRMSGLTKSGISKLIGTKIYKEMTMRNYNTTSKLLALMEKK